MISLGIDFAITMNMLILCLVPLGIILYFVREIPEKKTLLAKKIASTEIISVSNAVDDFLYTVTKYSKRRTILLRDVVRSFFSLDREANESDYNAVQHSTFSGLSERNSRIVLIAEG